MNNLNLQKNINRYYGYLLCLGMMLMLFFPTPSHGGCSARQAPASFADLAEKQAPTVVNIYSTKVVKSKGLPYNFFFDNDQLPEIFRHFFDFPQVPGRQTLPAQKRTSLGSGVITTASGYILTNNHVVENADEIHVRLYNHAEYQAKIIGRDPKTDLALIKIDTKQPLAFATFGDSDKLRVGDWVIAIGNPFGFEQTVTAGIVSGKGRTLGSGVYQNFIQTDASINPGNSGGPLFNMKGELMGINTAIYSRNGGNVGLGFAIPANMAKSIFSQLKGEGKVTRGMMGVTIQPITRDLAKQFNLDKPIGALVGQVNPGSPAEKAGVKAGDVILKYQDKEIVEMSLLPALVSQTPVGAKAKLTVFRNGSEKILQVIIGKLPEDGATRADKPSADPDPYKNDLGLILKQVTPELADSYKLEEKSGLVITAVRPASIAARAGLQRGDVILKAGSGPAGRSVKTIKDFKEIIEAAKDKDILLLVKKNSNKQVRFVILKR